MELWDRVLARHVRSPRLLGCSGNSADVFFVLHQEVDVFSQKALFWGEGLLMANTDAMGF